MTAWLLGAAILGYAGGEQVATEFVQLQPRPDPTRLNMWKRAHPRAVILIHGLLVRPLSEAPAKGAVLHSWQRPDSTLVKTLAADSDVFALAYSQNVPVQEVAQTAALPGYIARLQVMGYREIVLVGHSAGGIISRQFVEDRPQSGVTKVVQICTPNDGSSLAKANLTLRKGQEPFMESLSKPARQRQLQERSGKIVPPNVEFVCIVAMNGLGTDGIVGCHSQWSEDLQRQGIPFVAISATHNHAVRKKRHADEIARAIREPQPRWSEEKVEVMRRKLPGKAGARTASWTHPLTLELER